MLQFDPQAGEADRRWKGRYSDGRADSPLTDMILTVLFVWQDMREHEMLWTKSLAHVHYWKLHFKIVSQKSNQERS